MAVEGERDLEDFLAGSGALSFGDEAPPPREKPAEEEEAVYDEPPGRVAEVETPVREAPPKEEEPEQAEEDGEEEGGEEDEEAAHIVWARRKFGTDPEQWAKGAYHQEQLLGRMAAEKKQAEEAAQQAYQYAEEIQVQAQPTGMPISAAEEAWVEESMSNPTGAAYQAARTGNIQLYNAVIERVAEMDPAMAANVGTQVQLALHQEQQQLQWQQQQSANGAQTDFTTEMGASFQRLGINVNKYGESMWTKIEELGEYHPYALAILGGDPIQRDLAIQAVYDLVRQGTTTTRKIVDEEREGRIRREGELRRNAAGVVTGSPHQETPKQNAFLQEMENEWRRRGQWSDEE
jgi:hypothetical protein